MLEITLVGTGGTFPLPNRWLTSLVIRYNGRMILIDCGEGTQLAVRKCGYSLNPIDIICITHFHADHIAGLVGLFLTMGNMGRTKPVKIIGGRNVENIVKSLCVIAPELPFELEFLEIQDDFLEMPFGDMIIKAFAVEHSTKCYGYSFRLKRKGKFLPDKAKELGIPIKYWKNLQKGESVVIDEKIFTPDMVMGSERKGLSLTYCTDTRPTQSIIDNAKDNDILICEGMYDTPDKLQKAIEKKHMLYSEAANIAKTANVKELWLTHYSPCIENPNENIYTATDIFENTKAGYDGINKILMFGE